MVIFYQSVEGYCLSLINFTYIQPKHYHEKYMHTTHKYKLTKVSKLGLELKHPWNVHPISKKHFSLFNKLQFFVKTIIEAHFPITCTSTSLGHKTVKSLPIYVCKVILNEIPLYTSTLSILLDVFLFMFHFFYIPLSCYYIWWFTY